MTFTNEASETSPAQAQPEGMAEPDPAPPAVTLQTFEGFAQLQWEPRGGPYEDVEYQLQRSYQGDFSDALTLYRGRDLASLVSGLPDGTTWYRVRAVRGGEPAGPWSPILAVHVVYPASWKAVAGLIVGSIVLAVVVGVIVGGHRRVQAAGGTA